MLTIKVSEVRVLQKDAPLLVSFTCISVVMQMLGLHLG